MKHGKKLTRKEKEASDMPRWFWKVLWVSQVINWIVVIWAYGTPDGSCLLAPLFTIAWVLKDEYEDDVKGEYTYYQMKKGA